MEYLDYSQRRLSREDFLTGIGVSILIHALAFSMTLFSHWGGAGQKVEMPFAMVNLVSHEELGGLSSPAPAGIKTDKGAPAAASDAAPRAERRSSASPANPVVPVKRLHVGEPVRTTPSEIKKLEAPEVPRAAEGLRKAPSVEKNLDQLIPRSKPDPKPQAIVQEARKAPSGGGSGSGGGASSEKPSQGTAASAAGQTAQGGTGTGGSADREKPGSGSPQGTQLSTAVLNLYAGKVKQSITRYWKLPEAQKLDGLEAILVVVIDKNGKVLSLQVEKKSGNALFDEAAVRAVRRAEPLDPFPEAFQVNQLEFGISFRPEGLT